MKTVIFIFVSALHFILMRTYLPIKQISKISEVNEAALSVRLITHKKKRIVRSLDPKDSEATETDFLSDKDRKFDRQVKAKITSPFEESSTEQKKRAKERLELSDIGNSTTIRDSLKEAKKTTKSTQSTSDYLEEIPVGDLTQLNTTEYKYYGFYHRVRQKLEQFWGASIQEKSYALAKQGRQLATDEEMITSVQVTLDQFGEIISIKILSSSGQQELDESAVESFNEAGPFPNPPKGMIKDGKVTLEWGFVVKT